MSAWNPAAFSLAAAQQPRISNGVVRTGTERRYDPAAPPYNDTANAGGSRTRAGNPAGFQPDDSVREKATEHEDQFETMLGPIADDELSDRARGLNDISRGDMRDVVMAREGAPVRRAEMHGVASSPFLRDVFVSSSSLGASSASASAVARAGSGGNTAGANAGTAWRPSPNQQQNDGYDDWRSVGVVESQTQGQRQGQQGQGQGQGYGGAAWPTTSAPTRLQTQVPNSFVNVGAGSRRHDMTDYDLRVAANGMADFEEDEGSYPGGDLAAGVPRRQDMGMMIAHASQTGDWRALVSSADGPSVAQAGHAATEPGHQSGRRVAGGGLARAAAFAQQDYGGRWNDGKFGHGDSVDAKFVGVSVNPYSGVEYDEYENEAPAPTGDYRQKESAMHRQFESVMGGYAPGRPLHKNTEVEGDWTDAMPDVNERDPIEYARSRAIEYAQRAAFWAPHTDAAAWTDGEGYASLPAQGIPVNRVGYNEAVRFPAMPALHLHAGLSANPMTGGGAQPGEDGSGLPDGPSAPASIAVRIKKAPVVSVRGAVGQGVGPEGAYTPAEDPLTHTLSQRDDLLLALGSAFFALTAASGGGESGGATAPPEAFPAALRTAATDPLLLGTAMVDVGLTGPSGAGSSDHAEFRRTARADERARAVGDVGMALITRQGEGGGGIALPAELMDMKPQERELLTLALGRAILHLTDGLGAAGGGASNVAPGTWADAQGMGRRAPARSESAWAAAASAYLANVVAVVDAGAQPAGDPLSRALSGRDDLLRALGTAFIAVTSSSMSAAGSSVVPPSEFPPALKAAAANPLLLGTAMVEMGLVGGGPSGAGLGDHTAYKRTARADMRARGMGDVGTALITGTAQGDGGGGPSGAGLGDHAAYKRTARADMRAMGVGDVGMALITRMSDGGPALPAELQDLKPQERDLLTLALGRALLHMTDGALHASGGGGPVLPSASFEKARREPAFIEALGRLTMQLAGDAMGPASAPDNWADAQGMGRTAPARSEVAWARDLGSRIAGVCVEAEGLGTAALQDADAPKKRKLAAYAQAIARKLENINAGLVNGEGAGTGGLAEFTRFNRARKDTPNLRSSAPLRIIDGADGVNVATDEFQRWAARAGLNTAVTGALDSDDAQAMPPTRDREWTRSGLRFGGNSISTRMDNYASGGNTSGGGAGAPDYTELDTRYFESEN